MEAATTPPRPLLTVRQVAEVLNIAPGTAYRWVSEGRLQPVRFGNPAKSTLRFRPEDIEALLNPDQGRSIA